MATDQLQQISKGSVSPKSVVLTDDFVDISHLNLITTLGINIGWGKFLKNWSLDLLFDFSSGLCGLCILDFTLAFWPHSEFIGKQSKVKVNVWTKNVSYTFVEYFCPILLSFQYILLVIA